MLSAVSSAACAGEQPEFHLGQTELRIGTCHSIVSGQHNLETSAETGAFDGRNDRLGARLDLCNEIAQGRTAERGRRAELADIRTAREQRPAARQHDGAHVRLAGRPIERCDQLGTHRVREAIDRRMAERDDGDRAITPVVDVTHRNGSSIGKTTARGACFSSGKIACGAFAPGDLPAA
jgi:hypothetical protein